MFIYLFVNLKYYWMKNEIKDCCRNFISNIQVFLLIFFKQNKKIFLLFICLFAQHKTNQGNRRVKNMITFICDYIHLDLLTLPFFPNSCFAQTQTLFFQNVGLLECWSRTFTLIWYHGEIKSEYLIHTKVEKGGEKEVENKLFVQ